MDVADFTDVTWVRVTQLPAPEEDAAALAMRVRRRRQELAEKRGGRRVLGAANVLRQDPFDAPQHPKRSPMPMCHASTPDLWFAFRDGWRRFLVAYREASAAFRQGDFRVLLPDFSFRPWTPPL
ncbi:MAG: hypothetical protein H6730_31425 [Deltaproteobacteria bacterium]|nr:hypothetical protein [Deltaproteobacteria bacterium]